MPEVTPSQLKRGEEGKRDFLDKCFHATKQEGKPQEQRIAQCLSMWRQAVEEKRAKGSCEDPKWEDFEVGGFILFP